MTKVRVGINGFGRIGRCVFRAAQKYSEIEIIAINDLTDPETMAHLLKYDSVHGLLEIPINVTVGGMIVGEKKIKVFSEKDPENIPWKKLGVEIVVEATGHFSHRDGAAKHLIAGAKKVIISSPAKEEDLTIVMGVNEAAYRPENHHVLSNASCTTNCLAPVLKVLHEAFGVQRGFMTTVHSYTNDQQILDFPHKDLRRARAAGLSIIPTTTGAAKAVARVLPELDGKLNGLAFRVPTPNVSVVDLVVELGQTVTSDQVNQVLEEGAMGEMKGIIACSDEPLVSRDYVGNPHSSIVDTQSTMVLQENLAKVVCWYDNEWGYSNRVLDLVAYVANRGL